MVLSEREKSRFYVIAKGYTFQIHLGSAMVISDKCYFQQILGYGDNFQYIKQI